MKKYTAYLALLLCMNLSFLGSAQQTHPSLSVGDERLCILLKLGYSNSHMSDILGVTKDSVVKGKSRLKAKLIVAPSTVSLNDYLKKF